MTTLFYWLYSTIPFIQLFNNRFNVLGLFWFISLTGLTYFCLRRSNFSFGDKTKDKPKFTSMFTYYLGLLAISIFTVWVFYRFLDELLTIFTVVSWDASLLSLYPESIIFWIGKILSYSIVLLGLVYIFKSLKIQIFKMKWFSWLIFYSIMVIQRWSVSIFKIDYAVLTGLERINVFWTFYPILYFSYAVLYLSTIKSKWLF